MTKIDVYSGFLGAGKTTLIKKMIAEAYRGQKVVLIENEFGEIGIDGGFLKDAGIEIKEMNSGCICCSLVGDFGKALEQVIHDYHPDRVIIEPSGVGKLSDVIGAVNKVVGHDVSLGYTVAVADATKVKSYMKNFGEFYNNQIETASTIILSRTGNMPQEKLDAAVALIREHNDKATLVTTPWDQLTGVQIQEAMEHMSTLASELAALEQARLAAEDDDDDDDDCCCHHHHHDHDHEDHDEEHEHHHDHDHEHCCHPDHDEEDHAHDHEEHEHHHDHEDHDHCCHHDHDHEEHDHEHHHHHHHHADEVFTSWGVETTKKFTQEEIRSCLEALDSGKFGAILRAKGIVAAQDGSWIHFDFVPSEIDLRTGPAAVIGRLCVIGAQLDEDGVAKQFGV